MIQHIWPVTDVTPETSLKDVCDFVYFPRSLSIRSRKTKDLYYIAIRLFSRYLGREARVSDLDDDLITAFLKMQVEIEELSPHTANEKVGRLRTMWNWLARRNCIKTWPTFGSLPCPKRIPKAWRIEQLEAFYQQCKNKRGRVGKVPAHIWWRALIMLLWCTSERIGAALAFRWSDVEFADSWIAIPAELRKGGLNDRGYRLWPEVIELLKAIKSYRPDCDDDAPVFAFPFSISTLYNHYNRLLKAAGLPTDRKSKFHRLRVSHATWTKKSGGDPQESLGHSSPAVTRMHYLDPSILTPEESMLFRLERIKPSVEPTDIGGDDHLPLN